MEGYNEGKYRTAFPDGSYVESTNKLAYFPETWQIFKTGDVNITKYSGDSLYIDKLNKAYPIVNLRRYADSRYEDDCYGVLVNDRFCTLFPDGTISKPFIQKFGDRYYFANATDTIVDVVIKTDTIYDQRFHEIMSIKYNSAKLTYSNGDWVNIGFGGESNFVTFDKHNLGSGIIHRNGGIWNIGNHTLELPDGRVFKGEFLDRRGSYSYEQNASSLGFDTLTCYFGTMMLPPDGKIVKYSFGKTEEEHEIEAAKYRQQKEAEEKAAYNQLCTKFGKNYVDAALAGKPIVGMPEQLFVAFFKPELSQEYANSRCYHVRGWSLRNGSSSMTLTNKALKYSVWVTNGKISSISTW